MKASYLSLSILSNFSKMEIERVPDVKEEVHSPYVLKDAILYASPTVIGYFKDESLEDDNEFMFYNANSLPKYKKTDTLEFKGKTENNIALSRYGNAQSYKIAPITYIPVKIGQHQEGEFDLEKELQSKILFSFELDKTTREFKDLALFIRKEKIEFIELFTTSNKAKENIVSDNTQSLFFDDELTDKVFENSDLDGDHFQIILRAVSSDGSFKEVSYPSIIDTQCNIFLPFNIVSNLFEGEYTVNVLDNKTVSFKHKSISLVYLVSLYEPKEIDDNENEDNMDYKIDDEFESEDE